MSGTLRERMARVETQIEQFHAATVELHGELREHVAWERKLMEKQDARVAALEKSSEETRTHLKWMKALWVAAQGAVVAALGFK